MAWMGFSAAFLVFFLSHMVPIRPPLRPVLERALGRRGFTLAYSVLSLVVLSWLIVEAARAPIIPLWPRTLWQGHLALIIMFAACTMLAFTIARPNPFSFGGSRNGHFDPTRPGPVRLTRHPFLAALALWSAAHLAVNGDLAHAILFGVFLAFSLLGGRLVDRRKRRELGADWDRLLNAVRAQPMSAALRSDGTTALRLLGATVLYAALIGLHPYVVGVSPLP